MDEFCSGDRRPLCCLPLILLPVWERVVLAEDCARRIGEGAALRPMVIVLALLLLLLLMPVVVP